MRVIFAKLGADSALRDATELQSAHDPDSGGVFQFPVRRSLAGIDNARAVEEVLLDASIRGDEYGDILLTMFERAGIGLAIIDPTLRVQAVNDAFTEHCGRSKDEVRNRAFAELLHPSVRLYMTRQFGRLLHGQHARLVGRSVAMWASDNAVAGKLTAFPVEGVNGKISMILVLATPDRAQSDRQTLVNSQWKVTPLTAKVLEGVAAGDPTVRLAAKLFLSRQGIEYHVSILLRQFKVPNRAALAAKAYSMGMFSVGCWPPKVLPDYIRGDRSNADRERKIPA